MEQRSQCPSDITEIYWLSFIGFVFLFLLCVTKERHGFVVMNAPVLARRRLHEFVNKDIADIDFICILFFVALRPSHKMTAIFFFGMYALHHKK